MFGNWNFLVRGEPSASFSALHTIVGVSRGKKQAGGGGVKGVLSGTSIIRRSNLPTFPERKPRISLRNIKSRNYPITAVVLLTLAKFQPRPGYRVVKSDPYSSRLCRPRPQIFTTIEYLFLKFRRNVLLVKLTLYILSLCNRDVSSYRDTFSNF